MKGSSDPFLSWRQIALLVGRFYLDAISSCRMLLVPAFMRCERVVVTNLDQKATRIWREIDGSGRSEADLVYNRSARNMIYKSRYTSSGQMVTAGFARSVNFPVHHHPTAVVLKP